MRLYNMNLIWKVSTNIISIYIIESNNDLYQEITCKHLTMCEIKNDSASRVAKKI
jgi:hypothetical protein